MKTVYKICVIAISLQLYAMAAAAGIVLDGTMGRSGALTGPQYAVTSDLGKQYGGNLFHSFSAFNLIKGDTALFSGPTTVQNIISRVTGGSASSIDGTISSSIQGANMYLINPAGLMFGPNAKLDISGSFYTGTADYLKLGTMGRFDATNPSSSILTVDQPSAFGFVSNTPQGISVNNSFLEVPMGKTISLIGGDVGIQNGNLYSPSGSMNLVSAASSGETVINGTSIIQPDTFSSLGTISITNDRSMSSLPVDSDGNTLGNLDSSGIYIRGGHLLLDGGSIVGRTYGEADGKGVNIKVNEGMDAKNSAVIATFTLDKGKAGDISIEANNLSLSGPSEISSFTSSDGNSGNIALTVPVLTLDNHAKVNSVTYGNGDAGTITLDVGTLNVKGGSNITSGTFGAGNCGLITINAKESITLNGYFQDGSDYYRSAIASVASDASTGHGGNIAVTTPTLLLDNFATISTAILGGGDAGAIALDVGTLNVKGGSNVTSGTFGAGNGGSITINAKEAIELNGYFQYTWYQHQHSSIQSESSSGTGFGGNISLTTPALALDNFAAISTETYSTGNAGTITIDVGTLNVKGGSKITSGTFGGGNGGSISINAKESVAVNGYFQDMWNLYQRSSVQNESARTGRGGNIFLTTPALALDNFAYIGTPAKGPGNAGTITLDVGTLNVKGGASIDSSSLGDGNGGLITINAKEFVALDGHFQDSIGNYLYSSVQSIVADKSKALGGNIFLTTPALTLDNNAFISTETQGPGNAGAITLDVGTLNVKGGATIDSQTFGAGNGGPITINAKESVALDGYFLDNSGDYHRAGVRNGTTDGSAGRGGNIFLTTPTLTLDNYAIIDVGTKGPGNAGAITLDVGTLNVKGGASIMGGTSGAGNGSLITIKAKEAVVLSGYFLEHSGAYSRSAVASIARNGSTGQSGNIFLTTPTLTLGNRATISTEIQGSGNSGTITLDVGILNIKGGAGIANNTYGIGNGGIITINATESVALNGYFQNGDGNYYRSSVASVAIDGSTGCGGSIFLTTPILTLDNYATISTETQGPGNAGTIVLDVEALNVKGGANVVNNTYGVGNGGIITINVRGPASLGGYFMDNNGDYYHSSVESGTSDGSTGRGGNISLVTPTLTLDKESYISAATRGQGDGGTIRLDVGTLTVKGGASIFSDTSSAGNGGFITINAKESVAVNGTSTISSESTGTGKAGDIIISAANSLKLQDSSITAATANADGGNIKIDPELVDLRNSSITATVKGGTGNGGNIDISGKNIIVDSSKIIANAEGGNGGNINVNATLFLTSPNSIVTASSQLGLQGTVEIKAPVINVNSSLVNLPAAFLNIDSLAPKQCATTEEEISTFTVAFEGIPPKPDQAFRSK